MPQKYQKQPNKNRKYTHNRPYHGQWWEYGKEETKQMRKLMKGLRHKLLFHIPLTEDEEIMVKKSGLKADSALDRQGYIVTPYHWVKNEKGEVISVPGKAKTNRWRFLNPKEMKEKYNKS